MVIENARYENGELHLRCSPIEGVRFTYSFRGGDYDIVPHREKRSINANSYAWVLINRIAEKVKLPPEEVYRNQINEMPNNCSDPELVPLDKLEAAIIEHVNGHLGRRVKVLPGDKNDSVYLIKVYGSSDFTVKQMTKFIDNLVQDAKALGIETKPHLPLAAQVSMPSARSDF